MKRLYVIMGFASLVVGFSANAMAMAGTQDAPGVLMPHSYFTYLRSELARRIVNAGHWEIPQNISNEKFEAACSECGRATDLLSNLAVQMFDDPGLPSSARNLVLGRLGGMQQNIIRAACEWIDWRERLTCELFDCAEICKVLSCKKNQSDEQAIACLQLAKALLMLNSYFSVDGYQKIKDKVAALESAIACIHGNAVADLTRQRVALPVAQSRGSFAHLTIQLPMQRWASFSHLTPCAHSPYLASPMWSLSPQTPQSAQW